MARFQKNGYDGGAADDIKGDGEHGEDDDVAHIREYWTLRIYVCTLSIVFIITTENCEFDDTDADAER